MKKVLPLALVALAVVVAVWARTRKQSTASDPQWAHLRLSAESIGLGPLDSVENGFCIFLQEVGGKRETQRIHLYRIVDGQRSTIDPLGQVPEADEINVYDVSVGKSGIVAVGANAVAHRPRERIVPLLLVYNTGGDLLAAHRLLGGAGPIYRLSVDDDDAVWAVTRGMPGADPTNAPFLYKYTELGGSATVAYTRARIPEIDVLRPYNRGIGSLSFGTTAKSVYCWIPAIQEMVVMAKDGSEIRRFPLAVPRSVWAPADSAGMIFRVYFTDSGTALADVRYECKDASEKAYWGTFAYAPSEASWTELKFDLPTPAVACALVGVDGERPVLASKWKSWTERDSSYQLFKPVR